jgi:hypothetical protein
MDESTLLLSSVYVESVLKKTKCNMRTTCRWKCLVNRRSYVMRRDNQSVTIMNDPDTKLSDRDALNTCVRNKHVPVLMSIRTLLERMAVESLEGYCCEVAISKTSSALRAG